MIYLDNAATSFPKPSSVLQAVSEALAVPASPGRSGHSASLGASRVVYKARKNIAKLVGVKNNAQIVLTANITWAINQVIEGLAFKAGDHVLSSSLEHNSVARPLRRLALEKGVIWETVPLGEDGYCPPGEFKKMLRPETKLVAVTHASNVSGVILDVKGIKDAVGEVPILIDAAQSAGVNDLSDMGQWADFIAFTGHKALFGPTGTGALYVAPHIKLRPLAAGGTGSKSESLEQPDFLPDALEPGTPNTHGLAGLAAGLDFVLSAGPENIGRHEMNLCNSFLEGLSQIKKIKIIGPQAGLPRVATVSVIMDGKSVSDLSADLDSKYGIMTRAGLHCAPLAHMALGTFPSGALRFSFGFFNTQKDLNAALKALDEISMGC